MKKLDKTPEEAIKEFDLSQSDIKYLKEEIKGWKNAGRDIAKIRSDNEKSKSYEIIRFTKTGKPQENKGGLGSLNRSKSLDNIKRRLKNLQDLNPKSTYKIRDNNTGEYLD